MIKQYLGDEKRLHESLESLKYYVKNYKIFIDTCSIMTDQFKIFIDTITPIMIENNKCFIVALQVIKELEKHSQNDAIDEESDRAKKEAKQGLRILAELQNKNIIAIYGSEKDKSFADRVFHYVFEMLRTEHKLLFITQDQKLAEELLMKNYLESSKGKKILCKKILRSGMLKSFYKNQDKSLDNSHMARHSSNKNQLKESDSFALSTQITTIADTKLTISFLPKEQDEVLVITNPNLNTNNTNSRIILLQELAKGGEGSIYGTNTQYVAKIYIKDKITQRRYEKIKLMLTKKIECIGVCYPVAILHNTKNEFVGYLMPKAKGFELSKSIFKKPLFQKKLPNWTRKDLVQLCISILEKIDYLHKHNIILGDINPANILVVSPQEVYFVDTDSYQIEGFPCPVGTENFTASEILSKNYATFLRTKGNEYFAIATLLFMILLPGKPPYAQQDGESAGYNIKLGSFPYPFGEQSTKKAPDGLWRFMWSHMPYFMKEAFYKSFMKGKTYFLEGDRLDTQAWIGKFKSYLTLLNTGKLQEQDSMANDIYPTRFKKQEGIEYAACKKCGKEEKKDFMKHGLCYSCKTQSNTHRQKIYCKIPCKDCGNIFAITQGEYDYYSTKNITLPKRCKNCRNGRQNYSNYNYAYNNTTPNKQSNQSGGFVSVLISKLFK